MLKISKALHAAGVVVKLEGRLAGPWVPETERLWRDVFGRRVPVIIDLSDVSYIDDAGRDLLATMHAHGSRLQATTCLTQAVVDEIVERAATTCPQAGAGCGDDAGHQR